jgi:hypothetical protein
MRAGRGRVGRRLRPGVNPIASTIVERAAAIAVGDRSAVENLAATSARLGCPYQEARTRTLIRVAQAR